MSIGRVGRIGRVARVGAGGLGPDAAHTILTITDDGGNALVTTAAPHGLQDGIDTVEISGTSNAAYNGTPGVVTVTGDTTFYIVPYAGDSTGGTWALA